MEEFWNKYSDKILQVSVKVVVGLLILILGCWLVKIVLNKMEKAKVFSKIDASVRSFVHNLLKILLYFLIISSTAIYWGFPATTIITAFASAGIAISMALQGTLSNVAAGILILVTKPFKVGDEIEVNGHRGFVKSHNVIFTSIETYDNEIVTLPNNSLTNEKVINYSASKTRRIVINIHVSYNSDIDEVKEVLLGIAGDNEKILKNPAPSVVMSEHGESYIGFNLRVWCKTKDYWDVDYYCIEEAKRRLDDKNIEIPYPKLDVNIVNK